MNQSYTSAEHYSEAGLKTHLGTHARKVGREGVRKALQLYYALGNPEMPAKIKSMIYGALGYFILPFDLFPDVVPVVGFSDDLMALAAALVAANVFIDDESVKKANRKVAQWFGEERR